MSGSVPPIPEGAQVNQEEWARFFDQFGHARYRRGIRVVSHLPSPPRCKACGSPFKGIGGALMKLTGKAPSRKNPHWCRMCFEMSPGDGGATLVIGVLFADVRGSTAFAERTSPAVVAETMNQFYEKVTQVIVRHGVVDKLIGDEVMGLYFAPLTPGGRYVDAMVADARELLEALGYGSAEGPVLEVGVGLAIGPAFVGMVGGEGVRDFTALGDVVNTAARLQAVAGGGQIAMSAEVAEAAGVVDGEDVEFQMKGKADHVPARLVSVGAAPASSA
jgi:adenylate cyclase